MLDKDSIRRAMRKRRQLQTKREQQESAHRLFRCAQRLLANYRHIACFVPFDGEPNINPIVDHFLTRQRYIALPKIDRRQSVSMRFVQRTLHSKMVKNRFGIVEPVNSKQLRLTELDAILVPLTAFDRQGNRLGMGAGFYDRTLAPMRTTRLRKPRLIGVAFHWQEIAQLPADPWDLPLHVILTDKEIIRI